MYSPAQDGLEKTAGSVRYTEAEPPSYLSGLVQCFWELKTEILLAADFPLHALPDACVNILFNESRMKNIEALIADGGDITIGAVFPVECAATAADGHNRVAMLIRRDGETLNALLKRLDLATENISARHIPSTTRTKAQCGYPSCS